MLGWHISICRQENGGAAPAPPSASSGASKGGTLAVWQADVMGLRWIEALADQGLAVRLGGHGYPTEDTTQLEHVREQVLAGPPHARSVWLSGEGDTFVGTGPGRTHVDEDALRAGDPHEWVLITAWDES